RRGWSRWRRPPDAGQGRGFTRSPAPPDELVLVPPGNTTGWRAPARRRMRTDNAGVAPVRYTPGEHAPWERRAPARWAQSPGSIADEPVLVPPGDTRVGERPLADVCAQTTQA